MKRKKSKKKSSAKKPAIASKKPKVVKNDSAKYDEEEDQRQDHFVTVSKLRTMKFLDGMFKDRRYNLASKQVHYFEKKNLWEIFIRDDKGQCVLCILTPACETFGDTFDIENVALEIDPPFSAVASQKKLPPIFEGVSSSSSGSSKNQKTGTDFVNSLLEHCRKHNLNRVILVTDDLTPHAVKLIAGSEIDIACFTYAETCITNTSKHFNQPINFRTLGPKEREDFVRTHPNYVATLPRYSNEDPLVKYFGMRAGDIICYEDSDRHTAFVSEYGLVVENL